MGTVDGALWPVGVRGQFSVLSFSTGQADQVFSPSGDLRASGHRFPLLSSSSMTVSSGLWRAELYTHKCCSITHAS